MAPQSSHTLKAILDAFNDHDLDAIMEFFADDCSFDMPRGPEPWGERFVGKAAVRQALATRFQGLPDVAALQNCRDDARDAVDRCSPR